MPRMRFRLLALDLDGTLLGPDKGIAPRDAAAVRAARAAGLEVVLTTARPPRSTRPFAEALGLTGPHIHYNGALIFDHTTVQPLHHQALDAEFVHHLITTARAAHAPTIVTLEILDRWHTDRVDPTRKTGTALLFEPDVIGPLEASLVQPVTKLLLGAEPSAIPRIRAALAPWLPGRATLHISDDDLLQLIHPQASKSAALAWLCEQKGIPATHVLAIGDAPNDIDMLQWSGLGVAMGNAWPEVHAIADAVTAPNTAGGVGQAIERWVLSPNAHDWPIVPQP